MQGKSLGSTEPQDKGTERELGKGCALQVDSVECFPPNAQILHPSSETMSSSGNGVKDDLDGLTASKLCGCMGQSEWVRA